LEPKKIGVAWWYYLPHLLPPDKFPLIILWNSITFVPLSNIFRNLWNSINTANFVPQLCGIPLLVDLHQKGISTICGIPSRNFHYSRVSINYSTYSFSPMMRFDPRAFRFAIWRGNHKTTTSFVSMYLSVVYMNTITQGKNVAGLHNLTEKYCGMSINYGAKLRKSINIREKVLKLSH